MIKQQIGRETFIIRNNYCKRFLAQTYSNFNLNRKTFIFPLKLELSFDDCLFSFQTFKDTPSGLTQFLATESLLKMMKNTFCFPLKAVFILKIFKFRLDFLVK